MRRPRDHCTERRVCYCADVARSPGRRCGGAARGVLLLLFLSRALRLFPSIFNSSVPSAGGGGDRRHHVTRLTTVPVTLSVSSSRLSTKDIEATTISYTYHQEKGY